MPTIALVLTSAELRHLRLAAEVTGETIAAFVRRAAIEEADGVAHLHCEASDDDPQGEKTWNSDASP